MSEDIKYCKRCDRTLSIENFCKNKATKDGHAFYCRECMAEYGKSYREERINTARFVFNCIRGRVKYYKNKPFKITQKEFKEWYDKTPKFCHYCDISEDNLHNFGDNFNDKFNRLTVDCMENDKGYVKGNLVLACNRCNNIKKDFFTHDEMMFIGQNFVKSRWERKNIS